MVRRKEYLQQLIQWKEDNVIKVVTGIWYCGKSTLLKQYQEYFIKQLQIKYKSYIINFIE